MASSTSDGKRPATGVEAAASPLATVRPSKQPRLAARSPNDAVSERNSGGGSDVLPPVSPAAAVGSNSDLICHMACLMDTGDTLYNFCVSVGPKVARIVREKYLHKNEAYVVDSLKRLEAIEDLPSSWELFNRNLPVFDKCRDNTKAWMEENSNWRERISRENIQLYKGDELDDGYLQEVSQIRLDANLVFNNPAVAIEIGLVDVVRVLVADQGININSEDWTGFNSNGLDWNAELLQIAMLRGDPKIVDILLSSAEFKMESLLGEGGHIEVFVSQSSFISPDCFQMLVSHERFDPNFVRYSEHADLDDEYPYDTPLLAAVREIHYSVLYPSDTNAFHRAFEFIQMLLRSGADPEPNGIDPTATAIAFLKRRLEKVTDEEKKNKLEVLLSMMEG